MKDLKFTPMFKKDIKKVYNYPSFNETFLDDCISKLRSGESLPAKCKDHKLSKSSPSRYKGFRDFHLSPDICVLYEISDNAIIMQRIGNHNNLQLTEEL